MGAADGVDARLGQAPMQHLALGHQVADGGRHVLNRHRGVDAVLDDDVQPVGAQAFQHALDGGADMVGATLWGPV